MESIKETTNRVIARCGILIVLLVAVSQIKCQADYPRKDLLQDIIGDFDQQPGWKGITPGESTESDLRAYLDVASESDIDNLDYRPYCDLQGVNGCFSWNDQATQLRIVAQLRSGVVSDIRFTPFDISMMDIMEVLGEPVEFRAVYWEGEQSGVSIDIMYPAQGIIASTTLLGREATEVITACQLDLNVIRFERLVLSNAQGVREALETYSGRLEFEPMMPWSGQTVVPIYGCP